MATVALALSGGSPAKAVPHHHHKHCHTLKCKRAWGRKHHWHKKPTLGEHYYISENVTCYHQGTITSAGTGVYVGEVASNELALGTRIRLDHAVFGRTDFQVEDHIGSGSQLDIYGPSEEACNEFGRQSLGFTVLK